MKKLSLKPEELRVESFDPQAAPAARRGTVEGHEPTNNATCICMTDDDVTCRKPSCPITCDC